MLLIKNHIRNEKILLLLGCFFVAFLIISICSKSSFLYPLNNWGDAGCYYVEGRGILEGMVPYRDLAEQKGPGIFFVYALGLLASKTSFIGIFLIEVICATYFLYYSIKTVSVFYDTKGYELIMAALLSAAVYASYVNRHGGGPEEMSLAPFSFMLFLAVRYVIGDLLPSAKQMIILGIGAGLIFWTKYTLCAIYIALLLFMMIHSLIRKESTRFWRQIFFFIIGCIIISIPILVFFVAHGALNDLFTQYFYNNIFLYRTNERMNQGIYANLIRGVKYLFKLRNVFSVGLIFFGFLWMIIKKKYNLFIGLGASFLFSFFVLNAGTVQRYGNFPLFIFCTFGFLPILDVLTKKGIKCNFVINFLIIVSSTLIAYKVCLHTHDILKSKEDMPQYTFAYEMESYNIKDYKMLYYGELDAGFYFASMKMPTWRAYAQLNQGGSELRDAQNAYVNNLEPDFIISEKILCDSTEYDKIVAEYDGKNQIVEFDNFGYELIDKKTFYYEEFNHVVMLYKKK
ncbi:glycosyltransferase family 39 protein [Butyrivibrio sp. WCE2006]|uniref:glycosyltransferase family 39 protein n=1 Tax=Butyrivibrio sp. WCE2006 TaxID=1410611 RepID=UPI0005D1569C|nr:glycosyltransferase family 39 protein [Butyrivibrio sp. WCE2006]